MSYIPILVRPLKVNNWHAQSGYLEERLRNKLVLKSEGIWDEVMGT